MEENGKLNCKMNSDLISVIVPIYNSEKYLKECIESIIRQTYSNLEILLLNDGSTDKSPEICEEYQKKDGRIRIISKRNEGEAETRNLAVKEAQGTFISFVDSDDYVGDRFIEDMYESALINNTDGVICSFHYVDQSGGELSWQIPHFKGREIADSIAVKKMYLTSYQIEGFVWNKMFRRRVFEKAKVRYEGFPPDMVATYQLIAACNNISFVNNKNYYYRQLDYSSIHTYSLKKQTAYVETIRKIQLLANKEALNEEANIFFINRMVRMLYIQYRNKSKIGEKNWKEFSSNFSWAKCGLPGIAESMRAISIYKKGIKNYIILVLTYMIYK